MTLEILSHIRCQLRDPQLKDMLRERRRNVDHFIVYSIHFYRLKS